MKNIRLRDLPSFIRTTNPAEFMLEFVVHETERARTKAPSAIILNTFDALEHDVLAALSAILPPVYSIGSLSLLSHNQITDPALKSISSSLWKEETECLRWLDAKQPNSVLYTHNGWNSTLESICSGVPMICWPFFAEQQTNCKFACDEWGVGMEIDSDVKRDEVEGLVRELMEGGKGEEMRRRAAEWKTMAVEATTAPSGSSVANLDKLVQALLLSPCQ
ncbi:unnamed protein product [Linum tenue]|uniref:Uncharacterized protein n=1 Tax=Linum tenue TaxID=586396 RepID=A0AAV0QVS6_9ROSI|nr:unnamed protein product [Linum tenue]